MISVQKIKGLTLTVIAVFSAGLGFFEPVFGQNMKRLQPSEVMPRLKPEADPLFKDLFKGYYEKDGELYYDVGNDGKQSNDELVAYVNVVVTGVTTDGRELYEVKNWEPVNVAQSISIKISEFDDGGILKFDPETGRLLYKAPGSGIYETVNAELLARYPGLREQLESLGFKISTRDDGSLIIIDDQDRLGNGPGFEIIVNSKNRRPGGNRGSDSVEFKFDDGNYNFDDYDFSDGRSPRSRSRDSVRVRDGGNSDSWDYYDGDYSNDGSGRDYGIESFDFRGPNGGLLRVRVSDADIVDPEKIEEVYKEFQIGNQTYAMIQVDMPGWTPFGWDDEQVIVRKGKNGEWYLIGKDEHAYIMDIVRNDPKYKDVYEKMKDLEVDHYDSSDYENVRKNAMKYPNSRAPRGDARIIEYPSGWDDTSYDISYRDSDSRGGSADRATSRDSIQVFLDEYRSANPDATLADIQAALDKRFGKGAVIISEADGGKYRIKYGPNGGSGNDSITFILDDSSSDRGPGSRSRDRFHYSDNGGGLDEMDRIIANMFNFGPGGGSIDISTSGIRTVNAPKKEKAEILDLGNGFYKMRIPILTPSGAYIYEYENLKNPHDQAEIDAIIAKYAGKGVDFSALTTAPGSDDGSKTDGGNKNQSPVKAAPTDQRPAYQVMFDEAVAIINGAFELGNKAEATDIVVRIKGQDGSTLRTFQTPLNKPVDVSQPGQLRDLLDGIDAQNSGNGG